MDFNVPKGACRCAICKTSHESSFTHVVNEDGATVGHVTKDDVLLPFGSDSLVSFLSTEPVHLGNVGIGNMILTLYQYCSEELKANTNELINYIGTMLVSSTELMKGRRFLRAIVGSDNQPPLFIDGWEEEHLSPDTVSFFLENYVMVDTEWRDEYGNKMYQSYLKTEETKAQKRMVIRDLRLKFGLDPEPAMMEEEEGKSKGGEIWSLDDDLEYNEPSPGTKGYIFPWRQDNV